MSIHGTLDKPQTLFHYFLTVQLINLWIVTLHYTSDSFMLSFSVSNVDKQL